MVTLLLSSNCAGSKLLPLSLPAEADFAYH